ncbi:MAG: methyltransferase domain-containing protein [Anaerolineae bacterium]
MAWWDTYFGELYMRIFEAVLTPSHTAQEVAWIMAALDPPPGAQILDLCCGHGRHAVPMAQAGYQVTGLDRSTYLLERARQAADKLGTKVHWVRGDMRHLPWRGRFDACINMFTSFGYFEDEAANQQVLNQVCAALRPGGMFLLDVSNRDYYLLRLWPRSWRQYGEAVILEETEFDALTCRFTMSFTWLEGGQAERLTHSVRYYTAPELEGMLRAAGLTLTAIFGNFDGSRFGLQSKRMIIVAQKP